MRARAWRPLLAVAVVGLGLPVGVGVLLAPLGASSSPDLSLVEGLICGGVVLLAEVVGLRLFGAWMRKKKDAEWLAVRNARIRSGYAQESARS